MDVSVIIPSYKPGSYLEDCLNSLASQTLDDTRFEIVLVLNGCNEPYYSMAESIIKSLPSTLQIYLFQTDQPGVSRARNMALDMIHGKYVTFIDDDDWVSPNFLESMLFLVQPDSIVNSNVLSVNAETGATMKDVLYDYEQFNGQEQTSLLRVRRVLSSACFKLIPTEMIGRRRFDTGFALGEDALFMASLTDRIHSVRFTPADAVYYRRLRGGSAIRRHRSLKHRAANCFTLYASYLGIYFSRPLHYNLLFFLNRLAAVSKWWFR